MKTPRYHTYTVEKYDEKHGYLGHCAFTDYARALQCMDRLLASGWTRARILGGVRKVFIIEGKNPA